MWFHERRKPRRRDRVIRSLAYKSSFSHVVVVTASKCCSCICHACLVRTLYLLKVTSHDHVFRLSRNNTTCLITLANIVLFLLLSPVGPNHNYSSSNNTFFGVAGNTSYVNVSKIKRKANKEKQIKNYYEHSGTVSSRCRLEKANDLRLPPAVPSQSSGDIRTIKIFLKHIQTSSVFPDIFLFDASFKSSKMTISILN